MQQRLDQVEAFPPHKMKHLHLCGSVIIISFVGQGSSHECEANITNENFRYALYILKDFLTQYFAMLMLWHVDSLLRNDREKKTV